jgi:DNA-binding transcriptional MerR regulator
MLYSIPMQADAALRIGELSKRSGVSPELLRAWERRYGLLRPTRSAGGLRLYSLEDLERVRQMRQHLASGLAAAEAAALVARPTQGGQTSQSVADAARAELARALDRFDEPQAQAAIDEVLGAATVDTLLTAVVLPYLRELGDRWDRGEASVAHEHFASSVLRGRMLGLARGWGRGLGPLVLLACLPGEQHELGLMAFGLALRARGWRVAYLGSDTPVETLTAAADSLRPAFVVVTAVTATRVRPVEAELRKLAGRHRVAVGGGAFVEDQADLGALVLTGDPVNAAEDLTVLQAAGR